MTYALDLATVNILSRASAVCGADFQGVLQAQKLTVSAEGTAFSEIDIDTIFEFLNALAASSNTRHFAFAVAETFQFDGLPEVSTFLLSSPHLREAETIAEWVPMLIHPALAITKHDDNTTSALAISYQNTDASCPVLTEIIAAIIAKLTYLLAPNISHLGTVHFRHTPLTEESSYTDFFRCQVEFQQKDNRVFLPSNVLDQALPGNLPSAHAHAEASILQKIITDTTEPSLEEQIRSLLSKRYDLFSGGVSALAAALHMHPRALQRKLKAEQLSYSTILADTRHQLACKMLADTDLDIESIGYKLGFQERRSFTQAFRKASGQAPARFRQQHLEERRRR